MQMGKTARRFSGAALAAFLCAGMAPALAAGGRDFPVSDKPALTDLYPDRVVQFPDGVTGYADVTYATVPGYRPNIVDIYVPASAKVAPKPLILFIHGGGWVSGHTRHSGALSDFPKALARLASEGFVVASLEYRLAAEARYPAQLQDARAALRFLKANAARYGIDPSRAGVWGGSAGGHLAALTAMTCGEKSFDTAPAPEGSECVQAAVIWYGVFDFKPMLAAGNAPSALLGCGDAACAPDLVARVSPITFVDRKDPPFLLIHGNEDKTVPVAQSHIAEAALKAVGVPVEAIYIPGVDHSFIGATPAQTREATLRAMNASFDFFHAKLDGAAK